MNRIVIIGNGFDIAHGLPTRYEHFINHLRDSYIEFLKNDIKDSKISEHKYFYLYPEEHSSKQMKDNQKRIICAQLDQLKTWDDIGRYINVEYRGVSDFGRGYDQYFKPKVGFKNSILSSSFHNSLDTSWGGIENDYKDALVKIITQQTHSNSVQQAKRLNSELKDIIDDLVTYLSSIKLPIKFDEDIALKLYTKPLLEWRGKESEVKKLGITRLKNKHNEDQIIENILFLNFNYTSTIDLYQINKKSKNESINNFIKNIWISNDVQTSVRYIHGDLNSINSNPIIFGYGDEQDEHQVILERMDNEFFKHIKSVQYTRTPYYREMIDFADADKFDIIIYGHSCSNTDRTLLNTLFEHDQCISIQPYLYDILDSSIYNNIYRCFKDKKLMRSRVVDQTNTIKK